MIDDFTGFILLNVLIYLPLVVGVLCLVWPQVDQVKHVAFGGATITFVLSLIMLALYPYGRQGVENTNIVWFQRIPWLPELSINYTMGVDSISMLLLVLTTLLMPISILVSYTAITTRVREYYLWLLVLQTGMMGVFVSLDFFIFYIFWEVMLVPMALLIGIWGSQNRVYAAIKFFLYTLAGSLLMLVAIIALFMYSGSTPTGYTLDVLRLTALGPNLPADFQVWVFLAFAAAFAVKVPMFPFHTWLPDAHVQAPTAGSIILAGVMLKMGAYGFIRFALPITPEGAYQLSYVMIGLSLIGIIYGAWVSAIQPDLKKLIAYSSVSHMGFVTLGLFTAPLINRNDTPQAIQAIDGAVIVMLSHGLLTGGLFLSVGVIYERLHTREIAAMGGLTARAPVFAALFGIIMMGSAGLPGLSGFVGEFLVLQGAFRVSPLVAAIATTVMIFAAVYLLWMFQRVMFQRPQESSGQGHFPEANWREWGSLGVLSVLSILLGVFATPVLEFIAAPDLLLLQQVGRITQSSDVAPLLAQLFR